MKKINFLSIILIAIMLLTLNGCKATQGNYALSDARAMAQRDSGENNSAFYLLHSLYSTNSTAAKITNWKYSIVDSEGSLILEVNSDNYSQLGYPVIARKNTISATYPGGLTVYTDGNVEGDIFNGKVPTAVILSVVLIDANEFEQQISTTTVITFNEVE